ncbi:MAG: 2-C-methyl-D-erythritol 4-phosphate cytidylyltransferase [Oscillospiraceae bacterium]|nr:2-C-methyl-D-erythritol 4-phosphate cytidylyltransferase [Oscillospiraceae bacterium]
MIFGAILAGGSGTRMHISSMPKQFLPLDNKPIIIHTLEKMLMCSKIDVIYIGVNPAWLGHMSDILEKYELDYDKVIVVPGGKSRNDTIFNIIAEIEKTYGENDEHIIVTHDAVRPFVTLRILDENIENAITYGACDTVISAVDTIVVSQDAEQIDSIPDRAKMYQGQTPQTFKINLLKSLYKELKPSEKNILTDACKICVMKGAPVKLVKGNSSNIKITTISDYNIAKVIVGSDIVEAEEKEH